MATTEIYTLSLHDALPIFFDSSEISESVNFCVMEAIKLCRLDTPIIFIEARINLSRFVVTGCAAKTYEGFPFIQEPPSGDLQERVLIRHHDYDQCFQSVQLLQWNSQVKFNVTVYRNLPSTRDSIMTS